jgi:hypothetical protein
MNGKNKNNYNSPKGRTSSCHRNNMLRSESSISTNKDTLYNRHSSSNRTNSNYSIFGNHNSDEKINSNYDNVFSFIKCYEEKKRILNNIIKRQKIDINPHHEITKKKFTKGNKAENHTINKMIHNKYTFNSLNDIHSKNKEQNKYDGFLSQYYVKNKNTKKNVLLYDFTTLNDKNNSENKIKTIQVLNLNKKEENNNKKKEDIKRHNFIGKKNKIKKFGIIKTIKSKKIKNGKLIQKNILNYFNIPKTTKDTNLKEDNNNNFATNKKKLEIIKKSYLANVVSSKELFSNLKYKMNNLNYLQSNILELNDKCLKYSDLIGDNLSLNKKENNENLNKYRPKIQNNDHRPLSYNPSIKRRKNNSCKNIEKKPQSCNKKMKKYKSAEYMKIEEAKQKREKIIYDRVFNVLKNDCDNNKMENYLNYFNDILKDNQEKKKIISNQADYKSKQLENNRIRNSRSYSYRYDINLNKGYNNHNIDKKYHIKYIYHPGSEINQNLYTLKLNEGEKNYYINNYYYKRKNKI